MHARLEKKLSVALTLFFVPVRFRTLSESETAISDSETAVSAETTVSAAEKTVSAAEANDLAVEMTVSAAETTIFRPLKRPFSYFRTRKRYAKDTPTIAAGRNCVGLYLQNLRAYLKTL